MWLLLFFLNVHAKQVCAPNDTGVSFSLNCKLVSEEEAKRMQKQIDEKKGLTDSQAMKVEMGLQSGKPGYYILLDGKSTDAIIMDADTFKYVDKVFKNSSLGTKKVCEVEGLHQAIGFTIFSVRYCK